MTKAPGEIEPPKQITKAEREARRAFRQVDAATAMSEHEIAQAAFSKNRERLKSRAARTRGRGDTAHESRVAGLSRFLCHLLERGNLSERVFNWLCRASEHCRAWSDIRNDASLRPDRRTFSNPKMPGHGRLPSDPDEILKHG